MSMVDDAREYSEKVEHAKKVRIDNLPKWAQQEIQYLHRRVDELEKDIYKLHGNNKDTNVAILYGLPNHEDFALPKNAHIAFYTGDTRERFPEHITAYLEEDLRGVVSLYIAASDGTISVHPSSTNAIRVRVVR